MHKKPYLNIFLILLFILAITGPALANDDLPRFDYTATYDVEGKIRFERVTGHGCSTGAEKTQTIEGYGHLQKYEDVSISKNIIRNEEITEWTVPEDAIDGLVVTTIIDLCARPMSTAAHDYIEDTDLLFKGIDEATAEFVYAEYGITEGDIINPYHPLVVDGTIEVNPMTDQVWAAQIATDQGHSGIYEQEFVAAYGPGPYHPRAGDDFSWSLDKSKKGVDLWWHSDKKEFGIDYGDRYVGNYFEIDQYTHTTSGLTRRLISMSNPFDNLYLHEEYEVTGMSEVEEAFTMEILPPGPDAITLEWYDMF